MVRRSLHTLRQFPRYTMIVLKSLRSPILVFFAVAGNLALGLAIIAFYHFEHDINPHVKSLFDAVWWGMATVTTLGYGDIVPMTTEGRFIALGLMTTGLICFVGYSALFAAIFITKAEEDVVAEELRLEVLALRELELLRKDMTELRAEIAEMRKGQPGA